MTVYAFSKALAITILRQEHDAYWQAVGVHTDDDRYCYQQGYPDDVDALALYAEWGSDPWD